MGEKLPHQRVPVRIGLGKQQYPGGKTIDAMHHQGALSLRLEFSDQQRQSGRSIGALNRHSQKSGRFVENDDGIVFIKHGNLARETRPAPVFASIFASILATILSSILVPILAGRTPVQLSLAAASVSWTFLHWLGLTDQPIIKLFREDKALEISRKYA